MQQEWCNRGEQQQGRNNKGVKQGMLEMHLQVKVQHLKYQVHNEFTLNVKMLS